MYEAATVRNERQGEALFRVGSMRVVASYQHVHFIFESFLLPDRLGWSEDGVDET